MGAGLPTDPSLFERKVIHVDMDAFFAAVEVLDDPSLRGRPVVVGGDPGGRGVVATASYEARAFGVRSAMAAAEARRLCPEAVFVRPRFARYAEVSAAVHAIFRRYSDRIEAVSLDEAYLDVTDRAGTGGASAIARRIRAEIREELGLTASAGVAPNKLVAKIASDARKPDGLTVVPPERVGAFVGPLALARLPGVGPQTAQRLRAEGLVRCADAVALGLGRLVARFGARFGLWLWERARGIDRRPVQPERARRSLGHEDTFACDLRSVADMDAVLRSTAERVAGRLDRLGLRGRTVVLKVRYPDFETCSRRRTLQQPVCEAQRIAEIGCALLRRTEAGRRGVRLLGLTVTGFGRGAGRGVPGQPPLPGLAPWFSPGVVPGARVEGERASESGEGGAVEPLDRETRVQLLRFVCAMAWADLEVVDAERAALRDLVRRLEIEDEALQRQVEGWLAVPPRPDDLDPLAIPLERRELFVRECQRMVEADGVVVERERDAMELLRAILGLL